MSSKSIWTYKKLLPTIPARYRVTLGEGNTPLVKSVAIGRQLGLHNLFFKLDHINPTGSYKDRFAAMVVSMLLQQGKKICLSTSSGNTGAALAAYCAATGIRCIMSVVEGAPAEKIRQMQLYGATVYEVKGFGKSTTVTDTVFRLLNRWTTQLDLPFPVSAYRYCPEAMGGVQTIAYEIMDELRHRVDHVFCPAGGGGLTLALMKGMSVLRQFNGGSQQPRVHCVQPEGNDTIAGAIRDGYQAARPVSGSTTLISGLQVPGVLDGNEVISHSKTTNGNGYLVTDEAVLNWQRRLAREEGIFCEAAGAVSLAALDAALREKAIKKTDTIVCLITGSGFKDMAAVQQRFELHVPHTMTTDELDTNIKQLSTQQSMSI